MSPAAITLVVLAATIVLFVWNRIPAEVVALGSAITLYATGVLEASEVFVGFGDPVIIFIATLFMVSEGLNATGVTTWAGRQLLARSGGRLFLTTMLLGAVMSALISVNGAVATLLPMVVLVAVRLRSPPSRLAMPLAFAAHAGSLLTLAGTPVNLIVSEAAERNVGEGFGFLEFGLAGVPLVIGVVVLTSLFGGRLLPQRVARSMPPDLSQHARTLIQQYLDTGGRYLRIRPGSRSAGMTVETLLELARPTLVVVGAVGADGSPRGTARLRAGDLVVVRGANEDVETFARLRGLEPYAPEDLDGTGALLNRELGVAEVLVSPRSTLVGDTVFPGMANDGGDLVVLAVQRKGHDVGFGPCVLAVGDILLLQGPWQVLDRTVDESHDLLAVHEPAAVRRQAVPLGRGAGPALAILCGMVLLLATGVVPPAIAGLLAAGVMILLRVVSVSEAYDSVSWTTLVMVAGMFPLSAAIQQTGVADQVAHLVVTVFGGDGRLLLLGLFLLTAVLGQVISNLATTLIVIPIALSAAEEAGVSARPVLMCVAVAAAAAFLTPIATAANLMVQEPGGYRFGDYWRFGLPMLLWFMAVAVLVVPVFWHF